MAFLPEKLLLPNLTITIFLFLIIPCASQLSFNYTDFSQTDSEAINMTGAATVSGSVIQLTPNAKDKWGRATYSKTMHLWDSNTGKVASFTTSFSFMIYSGGSDSYSDGLTFYLASPGFPPPTPINGGGIGLLSDGQLPIPSFSNLTKFVAVEFDTYLNGWEPPQPVSEHVGININSMASQNTTIWYSMIKENRTYNCSISYDPSSKNLSVTFTGFNSTNDTNAFPIKQHLSSIVDLTDHLPEIVEFGFSASTGLVSELHILSSWSFESTAVTTPLLTQPNNKEKESKVGLVVGLSVGVVGCVLIMGLGLV